MMPDSKTMNFSRGSHVVAGLCAGHFRFAGQHPYGRASEPSRMASEPSRMASARLIPHTSLLEDRFSRWQSADERGLAQRLACADYIGPAQRRARTEPFCLIYRAGAKAGPYVQKSRGQSSAIVANKMAKTQICVSTAQIPPLHPLAKSPVHQEDVQMMPAIYSTLPF